MKGKTTIFNLYAHIDAVKREKTHRRNSALNLSGRTLCVHRALDSLLFILHCVCVAVLHRNNYNVDSLSAFWSVFCFVSSNKSSFVMCMLD